MKIEFFKEPFSRTTKSVFAAIVLIALAVPAAYQYTAAVVNTKIDCVAVHNGKAVHLVSSRAAPTPTNATFFYSDTNDWIKENEITNLTCKEQK